MKSKVPYGKILASTAVVASLGLVFRNVAAGDPTVPRSTDVAHAERIERRAPPPGARGATAIASGNGVVEPREREARVAAAVPGVVERIQVAEGDFVERGTALVQLDAATERAALAAAEGDLAAARADFARVAHGLRREDVDGARAEADAAKAKADLSADVLAREEALVKTGAATLDEVDRARRTAKADQALFEAADAKNRAARAGSRSEDIASASARIAAATARRDEARARLDHLTVRAPVAGEVLQVKARVGEYYVPSPNDGMLVLGDTRSLRARLDIDERDVAKVRPGLSAYVTADAYPGVRFPAKVVEVGRRMGRKNVRTDDPVERIDTKILEVVVDLEKDVRLLPGLRVVGYVGAT